MLKKPDLEARHVHSLLAAAMAEPLLLESWRSRGSRGKKTAPAKMGLDIEKVWQFAGLVTKVRYNDVRLIVPLTFKLLDLAGVSIEVFATYARQADVLRKAGRKSASEKLLAFSNLLDEWLDHDNALHALIWDLMRHESALFSLQAVHASQTYRTPDTGPTPVSARSLPVPRGAVVHYEMSCNPVELVRRLRSEPGKIPEPARGNFFFAYCPGNDSEHMRVLELDAVGSVVLDLCDGNHTVSQLRTILQAAGIRLRTKDLCDAISKMAADGLLDVASDSGG